MTPAGHEHGWIAANLGASLTQHVRAERLGRVYAAETGFRLGDDPDTVLAPDVSFVRRDRAERVRNAPGYFPGAPDLAVEVVSPGDSHEEVEEKVLEWLDAGCRMVVVVNPRTRTATVYRSLRDVVVLTAADALDGGDVVPGWRMPLRELFD